MRYQEDKETEGPHRDDDGTFLNLHSYNVLWLALVIKARLEGGWGGVCVWCGDDETQDQAKHQLPFTFIISAW